MNVLELFSGTHSVGKVFEERGHNVISLDLKGATINCNILQWDYKQYPSNFFDYIHASPPCDTFSLCRMCWIGREIKAHPNQTFTKELFIKDQEEIGLPILNKTLEIIKYFNPMFFTIENPQTGDMKKYIPECISFTDVDYCMYGLPYKKRTRIWNNFDFEGKLCNKECGNIVNGRHVSNCGHPNKNYTKTMDAFINTNLTERYRIPKNLIEAWYDKMEEN
jgi:hypothetical protein